MKNNDNHKYILFHLPLLQEIFKKPKTGFSDIFDYGIYKTATTQKVSDYNAIKQALYCYYRGGLTNSLKRQFLQLVNDKVFTPDEDYNGFSEYEFNPEYEIELIIEYLKENQSLNNEIIEFHQLRQIRNVLNITFDIASISNTYNKLQKEYNGFPKSPLVMIRKEMIFDFYKNDKSEFEKVLFSTYAGIRSIVGRNKFCQTTQDMIFYRMVGAKNNDALNEILKDKKVKAIYQKYNVRYWRDKILNELLARNFLTSKVAIKRRTYLSTSLNYKELEAEIKANFDKSIKSKIKLHKISELEAKNNILQHLYNKTLLTTL